MNTTPIQTPQQGRDPSAVLPSRPVLRVDLLLAFGAIGLGVVSLVTLADLSHAQMVRQAAFLAVGLVLMLGLSRIDYSRLRELKWGLYVILIGSILLVIGLGHSISGTGSTRSITISAFSFQASEFGKVLLIVFLAAFVVDSSRKTSGRELVARVMLLALAPAMLVIAEPDLGSGLVYIAVAVVVLYISGAAWQHLAALAVAGSRRVPGGRGGDAGGRHPRPAHPGIAARGLPASLLQSEQGRLPAAPRRRSRSDRAGSSAAARPPRRPRSGSCPSPPQTSSSRRSASVSASLAPR